MPAEIIICARLLKKEVLMYTRGKWYVKKGNLIMADANTCIAEVDGYRSGNSLPAEEDETNAERICKCVNGWDELEKQRDKLLDACKGIVKHFELAAMTSPQHLMLKHLEQVIEKAE